MKKHAFICWKDIAGVVKNLIALVYLRVSTEEQAEKGFSIQAQRIEGEKKAVELGCSPENIHIFSDEGISGAILERPQLMAALNMLKTEKEEVKFFICYDSSRLSRNAAHQLILIDEIKKCKAQLVFLKNSYQDNAEGRFQLTVMAAVDEYERARLKLRTEMGKRVKASQHKLTHNPGLYGYDFDPITDKLIINEEHAKKLKFIFNLLIEEHKGPSEIAEKLNSMEIPSPRLKQWTRITVGRILSNPSYMGILYIRRYDTRECHLNKFKKKGEKIKVKERPQEDWIPVDIPLIIDKDTWGKAQDLLRRKKHSNKKNDRSDFLLTPLIRCGICGSTMNGKSIIKGNITYRYYICTKKYKELKEEKCRSVLINADNIEKVVWDYMCKNILGFACNEANMEKIEEEYISKNEYYFNNIIGKKEKASVERNRIITMFQKGFIEEDEMCLKLHNHDNTIAKLDVDLVHKSEYYAELIDILKKYRSIENIPYIMKELLINLNNADKKHILNLLISDINVKDNTISIDERI